MFSLFDIIFPAKCLGCKKEGKIFCEYCFQKIKLKKKQHCPICKLEINQGEVCEKCEEESVLNGLIVATSYEQNPLIQKSIAQFKYKFNENLSEKLAELLFKKLPTVNSKNSIILVPVPLHFLRKWQRGFNQSELLATEISKATKTPIFNLLKRIKNTPQQAKLKREERLRNLKGAFQINIKEIQKLPPITYELPTIFLIDDIASTLTTLQESACVLKKAGFKNVWGLVIARG